MNSNDQSVFKSSDLWKPWFIRPSGDKLPLFHNGSAIFATNSETGEDVLFVAKGFEDHADLDAAKRYLRLNGRAWNRMECVEATTLDDIRAYANLSPDKIISCRDDRVLFWSEGPHNKRCVLCRKDAAEDNNFEW